MTRTYPVLRDGREAAQVLCGTEGLYYRVACCCRLEPGAMYDLMAEGTAGRENLGLLAPSGGLFRLERRVPVKHLGEGELRFYLAAHGAGQSETLVPVTAGEPFAYLHLLQHARLVIKDGTPWILLAKKSKN